MNPAPPVTSARIWRGYGHSRGSVGFERLVDAARLSPGSVTSDQRIGVPNRRVPQKPSGVAVPWSGWAAREP